MVSGQYDVDPAELVDPRSGLFEAWVGRGAGDDNRRVYGSLALRGTGNWMGIIEPGRERDADGNWENILVLEGVTLFTDGEGPADFGLLLGTEYTNADNRFEMAEVRALATFMPHDRVVLHANGGIERDRRESSRTALTWGAGAEVALGGPIEAVAEALGNGRSGDPEGKLGLRWVAPDDAFFVDLTWAAGLESGGRREWVLGFGVPFGF